MVKTFRDLVVWQKAMDLVDEVYRLVRQLPGDEKYALGDQLRRAAVSVPSNIAEGFGRESHKDFAHFLIQARGSLFETETQLEIAARQSYIQIPSHVKDLINEVSKMLNSLRTHLLRTPH